MSLFWKPAKRIDDAMLEYDLPAHLRCDYGQKVPIKSMLFQDYATVS
jgi:hypothetical protein